MTIPAIRAAFPDEWVAAEVTKVDSFDVPLAGMVLAHSPEKVVVYQRVKVHLVAYPTARLFIFFTGDPIPTGVGVAFALC
jgi:hypothetical protein